MSSNDKILDLAIGGKSASFIADVCGVARVMVIRILTDHGYRYDPTSDSFVATERAAVRFNKTGIVEQATRLSAGNRMVARALTKYQDATRNLSEQVTKALASEERRKREQELRAELQQLADEQKAARGGTAPPSVRARQSTHTIVRSWAKSAGIPVTSRGKVSHEVLDAYRLAHPNGVA